MKNPCTPSVPPSLSLAGPPGANDLLIVFIMLPFFLEYTAAIYQQLFHIVFSHSDFIASQLISVHYDKPVWI